MVKLNHSLERDSPPIFATKHGYAVSCLFRILTKQENQQTADFVIQLAPVPLLHLLQQLQPHGYHLVLQKLAARHLLKPSFDFLQSFNCALVFCFELVLLAAGLARQRSALSDLNSASKRSNVVAGTAAFSVPIFSAK